MLRPISLIMILLLTEHICILQKNTLKLPIGTIKGNDTVYLITV